VIDVQDNVLRFLLYFVTIATTGAIFSLQFTKNRLAAGEGRGRKIAPLTQIPGSATAANAGVPLP